MSPAALRFAFVSSFALGLGCQHGVPDQIPPSHPDGDHEAAEVAGDALDLGEGSGEARAESPPPAALPRWAVEASRKIAAHNKGKTRAWDRLADMTDRFGSRLSGSKALERAIDWTVETMRADGLDNVHKEPVLVPHWVRGKEWARTLGPGRNRELVVLGLGMSVGTGRRPIRAEVAVVDHVDHIKDHAAEVKGKIVLINQAMPPYDHDHHDSGYGSAVTARSRGASEAARYGAVAVLVRSVTAHSLRTPHTGALDYDPAVKKIPAAAVTVEDAEHLVRRAARGGVKLELMMGAKHLPDVRSHNVIAELRGREKPEEVVVIGGHIDSWDVGDGATDDGAGCMMAMEAALMLKELGLVPRRTIRVVLFTNEENGLRGAKAYFAAHGKETHVGAIEADSGSGEPQGLGIKGTPAQVEALVRFAPLFRPLGADDIGAGWGGADISPLTNAGVLGLSMRPDTSHYFDLHHSPADTIEKIVPAHLQGNAAAMALMAYILAERD